MKYFIITMILLQTSNFSFAQKAFNLTGKTFEYKDEYTNNVEQYNFLSNSKAQLDIVSEVNGKSFYDVCICQYAIHGNKLNVSCSCEDKKFHPNALKETFIYDKDTHTLTTTLQYDQGKNRKVFRKVY